MNIDFYEIFKHKLRIYTDECVNDNVRFSLGGYNFACRGQTVDEIWDSILNSDDIGYLLIGISEEYNIQNEEMCNLWNNFRSYFYEHVFPVINRKLKENL